MDGLGISGNRQKFEQDANTLTCEPRASESFATAPSSNIPNSRASCRADSEEAELKQLREKAQTDLGDIDPKITDAELETKLVDALGMKKRAEQIRDKYIAVLADDDLKRASKRRELAERANRDDAWG
jgi:hypothetical protein